LALVGGALGTGDRKVARTGRLESLPDDPLGCRAAEKLSIAPALPMLAT